MMSLTNQSKGFILIEALLAVVILSTGITLVVQSLSASRRNVALSLNYTQAMFAFEDQMTKLVLSKTDEAGSPMNENASDSREEYSFVLEPGSSSELDSDYLKQKQAKLSWKSGRRENVLSLNTLVFTPPHETDKQN